MYVHASMHKAGDNGVGISTRLSIFCVSGGCMYVVSIPIFCMYMRLVLPDFFDVNPYIKYIYIGGKGWGLQSSAYNFSLVKVFCPSDCCCVFSVGCSRHYHTIYFYFR